MEMAKIHSPLNNLSIYIHIPWCEKKCPYCDFNSHTTKQQIPEFDYITTLIQELHNNYQKQPIKTIFLGGGTPSLFSVSSIKKLLESTKSIADLDLSSEITIECNPGTVDYEKLAGYKAAGINRISIGIQSFNDSQLQELKRIHSVQQAIDAVKIAKQVGFDNINLDLMFGLPTQTIDSAITDLTTAISLDVQHISWYQLTIEPETAFGKQPPILPNDNLIWQIQEQGSKLLSDTGFKQYEVSAWAKDKFQCRHNLNYWHFGDYLGLGAGAHSKLTNSAGQQIRYANIENPAQYLFKEDSKITAEEILTEEQLISEFLLNALRLRSGFNIKLFTQQTGLPADTLLNRLVSSQQEKLLKITNNHVQPTEHGWNFLNELLVLTS